MTRKEPESFTMTYDVFISYAHEDDRRFVDHLLNGLQSQFEIVAGRKLRVFFDRDGIPTAQRWEKRIQTALSQCSVMLSVLTSAYLRSVWCGREYDFFMNEEAEQGRMHGHQNVIPRIFPVMPLGIPGDGGLSPQEQRRRRYSIDRQGVDFSDVNLNSAGFTKKIAQLAADLHEALEKLTEVNRPIPNARPEDDDVEHPKVTSGYVKGGDRFVSLLAEAVNVTVIGWTNENLADSLEAALELKRARRSRDAFWKQLHVVFLSDDLLELVHDELDAQFPDREGALRHRRQNAGFGRRSLSAFLLRENQPHRYQLHECNHLPALAGTLFDMPDGRHIVQLVFRPPRRSSSDHTYLEFEDRTDQYFHAAFNDIVQTSKRYEEVLPVGEPDDSGVFQCVESRFRHRVLQDGSGATGWLPVVLVVTWWRVKGAATPSLQLRTMRNAGRELGRVSHLAGYINHEDFREPGPRPALTERPTVIALPPQAPMVAARRRLEMEIAGDTQHEINFVQNLSYYHPDKEHLYFWVFECELPPRYQFPADAEMQPCALSDLLAIRESQTFQNALRVCQRPDVSRQQTDQMSEVIALNLSIHGHYELAQKFRERNHDAHEELLLLEDELAHKAQQTMQVRRTVGEQPILGLSGLQYREFFTALLPLYARLGVPGALEHLGLIETDEVRRNAVRALSEHYSDPVLMAQMPLET